MLTICLRFLVPVSFLSFSDQKNLSQFYLFATFYTLFCFLIPLEIYIPFCKLIKRGKEHHFCKLINLYIGTLCNLFVLWIPIVVVLLNIFSNGTINPIFFIIFLFIEIVQNEVSKCSWFLNLQNQSLYFDFFRSLIFSIVFVVSCKLTSSFNLILVTVLYFGISTIIFFSIMKKNKLNIHLPTLQILNKKFYKIIVHRAGPFFIISSWGLLIGFSEKIFLFKNLDSNYFNAFCLFGSILSGVLSLVSFKTFIKLRLDLLNSPKSNCNLVKIYKYVFLVFGIGITSALLFQASVFLVNFQSFSNKTFNFIIFFQSILSATLYSINNVMLGFGLDRNKISQYFFQSFLYFFIFLSALDNIPFTDLKNKILIFTLLFFLLLFSRISIIYQKNKISS